MKRASTNASAGSGRGRDARAHDPHVVDPEPSEEVGPERGLGARQAPHDARGATPQPRVAGLESLPGRPTVHRVDAKGERAGQWRQRRSQQMPARAVGCPVAARGNGYAAAEAEARALRCQVISARPPGGDQRKHQTEDARVRTHRGRLGEEMSFGATPDLLLSAATIRTRAPSCRSSAGLITMSSPAARPPVTSTQLPRSRLIVTVWYRTVESGATVTTCGGPSRITSAVAGTRNGGAPGPSASCTWAYMNKLPGVLPVPAGRVPLTPPAGPTRAPWSTLRAVITPANGATTRSYSCSCSKRRRLASALFKLATASSKAACI